jgi:hypothetical protein
MLNPSSAGALLFPPIHLRKRSRLLSPKTSAIRGCLSQAAGPKNRTRCAALLSARARRGIRPPRLWLARTLTSPAREPRGQKPCFRPETVRSNTTPAGKVVQRPIAIRCPLDAVLNARSLHRRHCASRRSTRERERRSSLRSVIVSRRPSLRWKVPDRNPAPRHCDMTPESRLRPGAARSRFALERITPRASPASGAACARAAPRAQSAPGHHPPTARATPPAMPLRGSGANQRGPGLSQSVRRARPRR